jgi:hypothetical protein
MNENGKVEYLKNLKNDIKMLQKREMLQKWLNDEWMKLLVELFQMHFDGLKKLLKDEMVQKL